MRKLLSILIILAFTGCDQGKPTYHIEQSIAQFNDSIFAVQTLVMSDDTLYQTRIGSYESFLGQVLVNEYQKAESILNYFRDKEIISGNDTLRFKHLK